MFKNARQVEFAELVEVMRTKGIKPAGVARLLKISKASVSKILDGKQNPRENNLEFLRHIVAEHSRPEGPTRYPEQKETLLQRDDLYDNIQKLAEPERREAATFVSYLANKPKVSSGTKAKAKRLVKNLAGKVRKHRKHPPAPPTAPPNLP